MCRRARAGYAIGSFLPHALLGVAVGRFNYGDIVAGTGKSNAFNAGFITGLGVDWAITPGVFVRAEWEYVASAAVGGTISQINTDQLGIGVRF